jgi:hypothetical protein
MVAERPEGTLGEQIVKEMGAVDGDHSECVHFYRFQLMLNCRDYGASLIAVRMKVQKGRRSRNQKRPVLCEDRAPI